MVRCLLQQFYLCRVITYSKSKDQPSKVANPARSQLNRAKWTFSCPRSCFRIWSREAGLAGPPRVSLLISILMLNRVLIYKIPPDFCSGVHSPSGQSRVCRVTELRSEDVHCRESADTGPVNFKVVPNGCCLERSSWTG